MSQVRTYRGCNIYRRTGVVLNGLRWESYVGGRFVYADTLAGIRELIRHYSN